MDFSNAALLVAVVYGFIELAKSVLPPPVTSRAWAVVLITLAAAIGAVYLLGSTVWAHEQVIGGTALDKLGGGDKLLIGIMLGGGAAFLNRGIGAVMNIGQNQPPKNAIPVVAVEPVIPVDVVAQPTGPVDVTASLEDQ